MKRWDLVIKAQEGGSKMNASSTGQSQGSKVWSAIQGNIPEGFVDKDKHPKSTWRRRAI